MSIPHAASCAFHHLHGRFNVIGIEVGHFGFSDFANLIATELSNFLLIRLARSFVQACRFFQQYCRRRRLGNECEGSVVVNGDLNGDNISRLFRRTFVKFLDKGHNVDAGLT